ncbi:glycosyltransferase family 2 protein
MKENRTHGHGPREEANVSTVQIVIPCYNYGRYLRGCVASALSQEGVDVSVLIIDDCSSDDTVDVCRELAESDPRISFIHHPVNKGHIATYNEGLELVSADYVVLLSADDLLTPGALRRAADLMDQHPSVGLVYGNPRMFQEEAPSDIKTKASGWTIWSGSEWVEMMCRAGSNFICCPEVVLRTSVQHRIGGYDPALPHSGDMEMWLRAASVSDVGRVKGADQACYRMHPLSMQRTVHSGMLFDLKARLAAFASAFSKEAGNLPEAAHLYNLAKSALSRTAIRHVQQSIECGIELEATPQAYEQFASSINPDLKSTVEWRSFERIRARKRGHLRTWLARKHASFQRRLAHYQWRRSGVHRSIQ